jgi:hypothetical protein
VTEWEYIAISLGDLPFRTEPLDLLNNAGKDGWELVAITTNGIAYLKRQKGAANGAPARAPARRSAALLKTVKA